MLTQLTVDLVTYATDAVKLGVKGAFITDGRVPHALLNEILAGGEEGKGSGGGGTVVTLLLTNVGTIYLDSFKHEAI